jgi:hypothetical protein
MRSKTGCRGNPTSSGVNGLGGGSIRIQRATPHNHALRIIGQCADQRKRSSLPVGVVVSIASDSERN